MPTPLQPKGRGAAINPPNRFELIVREADLAAVEHDAEYLESLGQPATEYLRDTSRSVVTENDSPDISFRYSINPYRGCAHGCSYCYARPYHEYLGLSAGLDFETKILVKADAPELFREFLQRPKWQPEPVMLSGVTDCYQPAERKFRITRGILEVAVEARQPMSLITKNALVERDLDLLRELASERLVHASISITTLDPELARDMEPRTSTPAARLRAIRSLADAGIPVRAMIAPIIPGLNDTEVPALLAAVKEAGARNARFTLLRLPGAVAPVFTDWLERVRPDAARRVLGRIRDARGGKLNDSNFTTRMRGTGEMADQIGGMFKLFAKRVGLDGELPDYDCTKFRPPRARTGQQWLF